jgi:hypothetical protein
VRDGARGHVRGRECWSCRTLRRCLERPAAGIPVADGSTAVDRARDPRGARTADRDGTAILESSSSKAGYLLLIYRWLFRFATSTIYSTFLVWKARPSTFRGLREAFIATSSGSSNRPQEQGQKTGQLVCYLTRTTHVLTTSSHSHLTR